MTVKSFKDLDVWKKSMDVTVLCYQLMRKVPNLERFGLISQVQRAAASVPANIAEGHDRRQTRAFLNHLAIARGSLAELETHLLLTQRLDYLTAADLDSVVAQIHEVGKMLHGLQRSLQDRLEL